MPLRDGDSRLESFLGRREVGGVAFPQVFAAGAMEFGFEGVIAQALSELTGLGDSSASVTKMTFDPMTFPETVHIEMSLLVKDWAAIEKLLADDPFHSPSFPRTPPEPEAPVS